MVVVIRSTHYSTELDRSVSSSDHFALGCRAVLLFFSAVFCMAGQQKDIFFSNSGIGKVLKADCGFVNNNIVYSTKQPINQGIFFSFVVIYTTAHESYYSSCIPTGKNLEEELCLTDVHSL